MMSSNFSLLAIIIGYLYIFFEEMSPQICPLLNWIVFLFFGCENFLYILDTRPLSDMQFGNIFSHVMGYFFHSLYSVL